MNPITPIQRFRSLLKADGKEIGRVYTYAIFQGLVNLSIPLGIQAIVNLIQGGQVSTSWIILVVIVVLGIALTGILQLSQMRIIENLQQKIFARAAFEFTYRLPMFKSSVLERINAPELMNRFFDTISIQKGLSKVLIDFSTATLQVVFGLILLSFYHPFFIFFGLGLFMLIIAIFKYTGIRGLETSLVESKYKYKVVSWLENIAATRLSFKMNPSSDFHMKRTDENVLGYMEARESHFKVLKIQYSLLIAFKSIVGAGLLIIGGLLVLNQQMNIGQFIAAEIIILLVINSVEKLILSIENIYDVITALEKIGYVTDLDTDQNDSGTMAPNDSTAMKVDLENLTFSYDGSENKLFDGLTVSIGPGEHTYLVGNSGSGKSTLLYLLAGLYQPDSGTICLDGIPLGNYNPEKLRAKVGIRLNQETLFDGSIYENITLGRPGITKEDVVWASDNTMLLDHIRSLEFGFDTIVGPEAKKLPKSVVQKILLARSIVHRPSLLILENGMEYISETDRNLISTRLTSEDKNWTIIASTVIDSLKHKCRNSIQLNPNQH